jgi:hypothetical protein
MSDKSYLASLRGGSTSYKKQFLPFDMGAEFFSRDLIVHVTRPAVTNWQADPIYIQYTPPVYSFLIIQSPVMRISTYTGSGQQLFNAG